MEMVKYSLRFICNHRYKFWLYIVLSLIVEAATIVSPLITGDLIDALTNNDGKSLIHNMVFLLLISAVSILIGFIAKMLFAKIYNSGVYSLNSRIIHHLHEVSFSYLEKIDTAYMVQRINNDSNTIINFSMDTIPKIIVNAFGFLSASLLLITINPIYELLLFLLILLYIFLFWCMKRPLANVTKEAKEEQSIYFSVLNEQLGAARFIKLHIADKLYASKLSSSFNVFLRKIMKYQKVSFSISSIDALLGLITQLLLFWIGGHEVIRGELSIGEFTIVLSYFNSQLSEVRAFFNIGKLYQESKVSYERIFALENIEPIKNGTMRIENIESIEIKDLSFGYSEGNCIVESKNYRFEKGKIYYLLGANGVGKSTLLNLLMGLYVELYSGEIIYNNCYEQKNLDLRHYRKCNISLMEQNSQIITETMLNNFTLGRSCEEDVVRVCREFSYETFLDKFPLHTKFAPNDNSIVLSGGEQQKVSMIRQFIKNTEVMLFDEPTVALDEVSKVRFWDRINEISEDKIIIIVTHEMHQQMPCGENVYL